METLTLLLNGFAQCFTVDRMLACVAGVLVGTLTGVLPGIGVTGAAVLLLLMSLLKPVKKILVNSKED